MKFLSWLVGLFVPRETGEGEGEGEGGERPGGTGDGSAGGEGKPDWCPDKFYDPDAGVRSEVMAKSFKELEDKLRGGKDALKTELEAERAQNVPEAYELKMPEFEEGEIPDGIEVTLKPEDPIAEWFMGFAKEIGLSQDQFNEAVTNYIKQEVKALPNVTEELKKLGDYGSDRVQKVTTWLEKSLSDEHAQALTPLLTSAESVAALEALMKGHNPADFDGDTSQALTLEELQTMQSDPRYWRDQDKAFIKKVEAGYQRLYNR
jgi:hypothetical protein